MWDFFNGPLAIVLDLRAQIVGGHRIVLAAIIGGYYKEIVEPDPVVESGFRFETHDADLLDHARRTGNTTYHVMGTCRMGPAERRDSVVDPHLQLRGRGGLWVADTSIMPLMPAANTNAPALMIGERAADFILKRPALDAVSLD